MSNGKGILDEEKAPAGTCGEKCEVWSRCCGYFRPVSAWNKGKKEEFKERKTFKVGNKIFSSKKIDSGYDPQTGIEFNTTETELIGECAKC